MGIDSLQNNIISTLFNNQNVLNNILNRPLQQNQITNPTQNQDPSLNPLFSSLTKKIQESLERNKCLCACCRPDLYSLTNKIKEAFGNNSDNVLDEVLDRFGVNAKYKNEIADLIINIMSRDKGDRLFYQPNNRDDFFNGINSMLVKGADFQKFLTTINEVMRMGGNIEKFVNMTAIVAEKGDYDDLRRFFDITLFLLHRNIDVNKYYEFGKEILNKNVYDFESNIFALQTFVSYGGSIDDFIDIAKNLPTTFMDGRNNLVDLHRIIIDFKNKGGFVPLLLRNLAIEARKPDGNVREYMNTYMKMNGLAYSGPDFTKFKRIERIDGPDMVIRKGESAALFAQAISSSYGLLPESVLYWSSIEKGAMGQGSSYLDLSKLDVGVYNIAVKIGGYWQGGTDTAIKRVIVLPPEEEDDTIIVGGGGAVTPPPEPPVVDDPNRVVLTKNGKLKITVEKGSAGLSSDLYLRFNGEDTLITENAQTNYGVTLEREYKRGDKLDFFIRTHGEVWGLGTYDHGTNTEGYEGKSYVKVEKIGDNAWRLRFEDLPGNIADWDYDDVVIKVELEEEIYNPPVVNIKPPKVHHDNGHGNDLDGYDESNPGKSSGVDRTKSPINNDNRFIEDISTLIAKNSKKTSGLGADINTGQGIGSVSVNEVNVNKKKEDVTIPVITTIKVGETRESGEDLKTVNLIDITGKLIAELSAVKKNTKINIPDNYYLLLREVMKRNNEYLDKLEEELKFAVNKEMQLKGLNEIMNYLKQLNINNINSPNYNPTP